MRRTGWNHESSRVESCADHGRIMSRNGSNRVESRADQGRLMSRTGSNHELIMVES